MLSLKLKIKEHLFEQIEKRKGHAMKRLLEQYEKTIEDIEERIRQLGRELKAERNVQNIHSIERRIDLLAAERRELVFVVVEIKRHLAPKPVHPSLLHRNRAV